MNKEVEPSLFGMITNPTEQFKRIKQAPFFWKPLMIVIGITIIGLWITSVGIALPSLEHLTAEEIASGKKIANIGIVVVGILTTIVSILTSSAIFYMFVKAVRAKATFKQLFSMNTYIMLITAVSMVVNGIFIAIIGNYSENDPLYTSLAKYVSVDGKLGAVFNGIELFSIWTLILTALGLHHIAGVSKNVAWTIAGLFFISSIVSAILSL